MTGNTAKKKRHLVEGAGAMVAGIWIVIVAGNKSGFLPTPSTGYGLYVEATIASLLALMLVTLTGIVAGVVLAKYLKWRYGHYRLLTEGELE